MANYLVARRHFWGVPANWDTPSFNQNAFQVDMGKVVLLLEKEISRKLTFNEIAKVERIAASMPANGTWLVILFMALAWLLSKTGERKLIEHTEVRKLLEEAGQNGFMELDLKYYVPLMKETLRFLEEDKTDQENYVKEYYDCDDFARRLWGQLAIKGWADTTFGIAWSEVHMYNMLIVQDEAKKSFIVRIVEPQSDALLDPAKIKDMQVLYTQKEFDGKSFWVPVDEYLPSGVKLRRNRPLPSAAVASKDKNKKEVSLNPYDTVGVLM